MNISAQAKQCWVDGGIGVFSKGQRLIYGPPVNEANHAFLKHAERVCT